MQSASTYASQRIVSNGLVDGVHMPQEERLPRDTCYTVHLAICEVHLEGFLALGLSALCR